MLRGGGNDAVAEPYLDEVHSVGDFFASPCDADPDTRHHEEPPVRRVFSALSVLLCLVVSACSGSTAGGHATTSRPTASTTATSANPADTATSTHARTPQPGDAPAVTTAAGLAPHPTAEIVTTEPGTVGSTGTPVTAPHPTGMTAASSAVVPDPHPTSASRTATTSSPARASAALTIAAFAYQPTSLTVSPGERMSVANTDSVTHTVTSDIAGLLDSGDIAPGKTVVFSAPMAAGRYGFHCKVHPSMHATVFVT